MIVAGTVMYRFAPCRLEASTARSVDPMRLSGLATWLLLQVLAVTASAAVSPDGPGKGICHPECLKYGNCGDDGMCRCAAGALGCAAAAPFCLPD